jgi:AraC-like DNA-binding protein
MKDTIPRMALVVKMEMEGRDKFVYETHMSASWKDWNFTDIGLRILVARRQYLERWDYRGMAAPHWRLYFLEGGGAWVEGGGKRQALEPNRFWLVPHDLEFASGLDRPVVQFYVHFLIRPVWRKNWARFYEVKLDRGMRELWKQLDGEADSWQTGCRLERLVLGALGALPGEGLVPEERDPRAREVIRWMTLDPARPWTSAELARETGMHPHAFTRWFKQRTGRTPKTFLLERRVQEACLLLHHTARSIEDIASALGFCDRYHFSRVFSHLRGMGPAEFRRKRGALPGERSVNDAAV